MTKRVSSVFVLLLLVSCSTIAVRAQGILPTPRGNAVLDIVYDTATSRLWLATVKAPAVTADGGKTWKNFLGQDSFRDDSISCAAIAVKGNLVVTSTAVVRRINDADVAIGTGIHVSTDGGGHWVHYPQPRDQDVDTIVQYYNNRLRALPVTVSEQNVTYSIGIQGPASDPSKVTLWIASFAGGFRKSTDLGKTWKRVVVPPSDLSSIDSLHEYNFILTPVPAAIFHSSEAHLNYEGFSVLVENDSTIWLGSADGVNRSTDGGNQWVKFNQQNSSITGNWILDAKYRGPGEIWLASAITNKTGEKNGISYTTDDGNSWHSTSDLLTDTLSTATNRVHKLGFLKSLIYAANDDGIWRSADNGNTWNHPSIIFSKDTKDIVTQSNVYSVGGDNQRIFVGTQDGLVSTLDDSTSLSPLTGPWTFYHFAEPVTTADDETYAYPNPFQPSQEETRIRYLVHGEENVTIEVLDYRLRLVRTVIRDAFRVGGLGREFKELWDGMDNYGHRVPNGTYPYRVTIGSETHWGKIVVLR